MRIPTNSIFIYFAIVIIFFSCHDRKKYALSTFQEDNLQKSSVEIDNTRDTVLHAPGGSIISILAGSFEGANDSRVHLYIKEALNISDIVLAGLVTESNGKMLSSGGMIDIEPANDQNLRIIKPINVSLPTPFLDSKMSVFKGSKGKPGQINWTDPTSTSTNRQIADLDTGELIFRQNCSSCHSVAKAVTGPALAYISSLRTQKWLFNYTRNNKKILESGDPYANCLYEHYNKTPMPVYPEMSVNDLTLLYSYIGNESKKQGLPMPDDHLKKCVDSCLTYRKLKDSLDYVKIKLLTGNVSSATNKGTSKNISVEPDTSAPFQPIPPVTYYQFQVSTFGWYNIDRFCQDIEGIMNSRLSVLIIGDYSKHIRVYLIVPQPRVFQQGSQIENHADEYGFNFGAAELRLPQTTPASVIAIGEQEGEMVFDLVSFTTSVDQTLTLKPVHVSKELMTEKINQLRLDSFKASADETKSEKAIKKIDQQLASMKPESCDCNCGIKRPPVDSDSTVFEK
jgi:mono/diheme cytochrome c family protein